ncbi:MAG: hypothetical protein DRJ67_04375 [Thermoprotei archaeon]|nr:MAG: hypothetical protein DRJ67_04375 [Thermoprotei archaeon]
MLEPRTGKVIAEELALLLSKRGILAWIMSKYEDAADLVAGAVEFLVSEGLAKLLGTKLYIGETPSKNYVLWNGQIDLDRLAFRRAPKGLPDVEVLTEDYTALVEVTLGTHPQTLINELRELTSHRPRHVPEPKLRILVAPQKAFKTLISYASEVRELTLLSLESLVIALAEEGRITFDELIRTSKINVKILKPEQPPAKNLLEAIGRELLKGHVVVALTVASIASSRKHSIYFNKTS